MKCCFRHLTVLFLSLLFVIGGCREVDKITAQKVNLKAEETVSQDFVQRYNPVSPKEEYYSWMKEVFYYFNVYNNVTTEDIFSGLLNEYLLKIDPEKILFTKSDIEILRKYNFSHKNTFKNNLDIAYIIYNFFRNYRIAYLKYKIQQVNKDFVDIDFTKEEFWETDISKREWPANKAEKVDLWRKNLKNDYLRLYSFGEEKEKIRRKLLRRYNYQLEHIQNIKSEHVFSLFINSIIAIKDPHSFYMLSDEVEEFKSSMSISFCGIGVNLISNNDNIEVVGFVSGGPAGRSGEINIGDKIIGVGQDGAGEIIDTEGLLFKDVLSMITGKEGDTVRLKLESKDGKSVKVVSIVREIIKVSDNAAKGSIKVIENNGRSYKIGVISIPVFYRDYDAYTQGEKDYLSLSRDVRKILEELKEKNIDGLVLDLRNNPGGFLLEAQALSGLFLGNVPVFQSKDFNSTILFNANTGFGKNIYKGPLVVLVNSLSASASEIFAAAIQDYRRGLVIGSDTFGKGSIQNLLPLSNGELRLTIAKYYRVSGKSTQNKGVVPDVGLPNIYANQEVGERYLPHPLQHDEIPAVEFKRSDQFDHLLVADILMKHYKRMKSNEDFTFIEEFLKKDKENDHTLLSLRMDDRKSELDKSNEEDEFKKIIKKDPFLIETMNILIDMIDISGG